ncbi:MAG: diguanylate cyclase, partial [Gammaproteobacteria bacterium]|nr:diguanylate cyclase [Gammaproteobacteria bacterium]
MNADPSTLIAGASLLVAVVLAMALLVVWRRRARELAEFASVRDEATANRSSAADADSAARSDWTSLSAWLEAQPEITLVHNDEVLFANAAALEVFGGDAQALAGRPVIELIRPAYRAAARRMFSTLQGDEPPPGQLEVQLSDAADEGLWVELSCGPVAHAGGRAWLTVARDISYRKNLEAGLQRGKLQARMTLDSIGEGVITTDGDSQIDYMNEAAEALTGVSRSSAIGRRLSDLIALVDEVDRKSLGDPVAKCLVERRRIHLGRRALMLSKTGTRECSIELTASPIRDPAGQISGCVVVLHDVTELRGIARQMSYQASHDALTGLLNRHEFQHRLEEALGSARSEDASHVLCYLDLDRFKAVNDTCGHIAGDNMLRELAALIRKEVRDSDSVARLGGDEFGMLLVGCPLEKACQIAEDVCQAVGAYRFVWQDKIFNVGVSVGLVQIGQESGTLEDVLSAADSACYVAKQQGRGRVAVDSGRDDARAGPRGAVQWGQQIQAAR